MTKNQFCDNFNTYENHRLLLWFALKETKGNVVEYGSGHGSTPYLRQFCQEKKRTFETYDYNKKWSENMNSIFIEDWDTINPSGSVILIDHSPGERRTIDIERLKNNFEIMIIHDTEPAANHGYDVRKHFAHFKYVVEIPTINEELNTDSAWATALSNSIDITKWDGKFYTNNKNNIFTIKAGIQKGCNE